MLAIDFFLPKMERVLLLSLLLLSLPFVVGRELRPVSREARPEAVLPPSSPMYFSL